MIGLVSKIAEHGDDRLPVTPGALQAHGKETGEAFVLSMKFAASQQTIQAVKSKNTGR
jgi:hypothetical protein